MSILLSLIAVGYIAVKFELLQDDDSAQVTRMTELFDKVGLIGGVIVVLYLIGHVLVWIHNVICGSKLTVLFINSLYKIESPFLVSQSESGRSDSQTLFSRIVARRPVQNSQLCSCFRGRKEARIDRIAR